MNHAIAIRGARAVAAAQPAAREVERPGLVLAACVLASSLSFIDGSVLNVALPAIARSFSASTAEMQWVLNAFLLPLSALLLIGGSAGDHYGRRRMLIWGTALFTGASMLCAVAPSLEVFLGGRALQGVGAAMLMPNSLAILGHAFEGEKRGRAIGIWAAAGAAAGAIAPLLGGWLVDEVGWPAVFYLKLPIAMAAIWLAAVYVPESGDEERSAPDWLGALLVTAGLGGLTWSLTTASAGTGSLLPGPVAAAAAAALLVFLLVERRRRDRAMVPLALFASRAFAGLTLLTFLLYGAFAGVLVLLPYTLIEAAGYSPLEAGAALLPLPITIALASPFLGGLAARLGPRLPLAIGPTVVALGFAWLSGADLTGSYWTSLLPPLLLLSAGMAMAVAPLTTAVLGSVDSRHTGTASGLNSAVARTGGLVATALLGVVLSQRGGELIASFDAALLIGAGTAAAAGLTAFATLGSRRG